jgi:glycosyltransferase involved in cell wall biosynthesis
MPTLSVLLPCYNAETTIEECLHSLKIQTLLDFEVIIVNDGSTDHTCEIIKKWAAEDPRFKPITQEHSGIVVALNTGLSLCTADYVARMDADDRCHPERFARQITYLKDNPQVAVVGCLVQGFPQAQVREGFRIYIEWLNSLVENEQIRQQIFIESPLAHPSVTYRRALILEAGGYQEHGWPEDYDLWLRLYLGRGQFGKVAEFLFEWREYPQRLTRTDSRYSLENFIRAKAYYLTQGPLADRDAVIIWGAGMLGRRLSKHLLRQNSPIRGFIDIDPRKIGHLRYGVPILPPASLPDLWKQYQKPVVLAAVGARGARQLIRQQLNTLSLQEGRDWWGVA